MSLDRQSGAFALCWVSNDGTSAAKVRQYTAAGSPEGDPMTFVGYGAPQTAWQPGGKYVFAYNRVGSDAQSDVYFQRYEPAPVAAPTPAFSTAAISGTSTGAGDSILASDQPILA